MIEEINSQHIAVKYYKSYHSGSALSYHYGVMEGNIGELETMMNGANAKFIKENCPKNCKDCCAYNDNKFMESLWRVLKIQDNLDNIEFFFEY